MPKLKTNDISMYYESYGQGEPIIFISGFSADHLQWGLIVEHLTPYYQVILLDNRGAGQTDVSKGSYSIEQMAQDVADLCTAIGITKAHFVGNSMGGYIVQMLAYQHAELVKSIVISNSGLGNQTAFHFYLDAQLELLKANMPKPALIKSSCAWCFSPDFLSKPYQLEGLVQLALNNPFPFSITGFEGQYAALNAFHSETWIKEITHPALIISGEHDIILPPYLAETIHQNIPHSSYYSFNNCGHLPHIEYPAEFAEMIKQFFTTVEEA